jgi:hypothetical protein
LENHVAVASATCSCVLLLLSLPTLLPCWGACSTLWKVLAPEDTFCQQMGWVA